MKQRAAPAFRTMAMGNFPEDVSLQSAWGYANLFRTDGQRADIKQHRKGLEVAAKTSGSIP